MIVHQQAVQPSPSFTGCSCCLKFKKGGVVWLLYVPEVAHDSHVIEIQIHILEQQLRACSNPVLIDRWYPS